jgi:hypothetical protein
MMNLGLLDSCANVDFRCAVRIACKTHFIPTQSSKLRHAAQTNFTQRRKVAVTVAQVKAERYAASVLPVIRDIQSAGITALDKIANVLTKRGVPTARGGRWYAMTVRNLLVKGS